MFHSLPAPGNRSRETRSQKPQAGAGATTGPNQAHLISLSETIKQKREDIFQNESLNATLDEEALERLRQRLGALDHRQITAWRVMNPARRLEPAWRVTRRMQGNPRLGR